jgi:hypothetical protein
VRNRVIKPKVLHYNTPVHAAHPISVGMASALGTLYGRGINGQTGTIRYGYPAPGTRRKYGGYVNPPQMFTGWSPASVAGGSVRRSPGGLPGTQAPPGYLSPLLKAAMTVTAMNSPAGS